MASVQKKILVNETITAAETGDAQSLEQGTYKFVALLEITNYAAGTFNCAIEHSADGTNWEEVAAFANLSANGFEYLTLTNDICLGQIRHTIAGAGLNGDVKIELNYDKIK